MLQPQTRDSVIQESQALLRFLAGLPRYLRQRMSYDEALAVIRQQMATREANFLDSVRRGAFDNPRSPYHTLFEIAGCEFGDLEHSVTTHGIEATLLTLRHEGVYVSFEEFKGREPIVRGGREVAAGPGAFDNPRFRDYLAVSTSGSSGPPRRALLDLSVFHARLPIRILSAHYMGFVGTPTIRWMGMPPAPGLTAALNDSVLGVPTARWFTPAWGGRDGTSRRFRYATTAALAVARAAGARVRWPEFLPLEKAVVIARVARDLIRNDGRCMVVGSMSRLLRVSLAAQAEGIDLTGAVFHGGGEPASPAKVAGMTACGARFQSSYHFTEAGPVGHGCTTSGIPNDQHLMKHHLAMIQLPRKLPGFDVEVAALSFTTLLASAAKLLINVESDDYGVVETRSCACPWGALGFTDHITELRSFAKLTGEGVTLVGSDMERIIEQVLPATFGGSVLDYQLVEEEDVRGFTRLALRVSPSVHLPDESAAADLVYHALASDGACGRSVVNHWRQAGTILVKREAPVPGPRGKLFPLQKLRTRSHVAAGSAR